ncbi:hypothetical protein PF008_g23060 [Phytophthora fragariae]|uniref:Uncharacterized protein n=1 Tax=Phytophthora fragariae TaxID=53985 RepID=A0A6G0QRX2_9STRA|nr:hypothetical protein PF008_g23060 [Phytophthora fragariae]
MQTEEQTWRLAIEDEEAASGAVVEAERVLHRQLRHHRSGSPTVDDAVSDLDLRRTQYAAAAAVHATDQAGNVYYRTQGEAIAAERDRRRADHVQRIEAVLQQALAEQQHAAATNPSVARRSYSSPSENGLPPRPTKRLNLGPPSSGPAIETTGSEQDTGRSGESDDSSSSGNASNPPPLPLNALMPMALLDPQASSVPPSTPAPTPTEAQTPDYLFDSESESKSQPAESDGNDDNVESDGNDENTESDGNDENAESVESSDLFPAVKLRILKMKAKIANKETW